MNSKLLLIKSKERGTGVKQHWQGVQSKRKRQGPGWGEVLKYQEEPMFGARNGQDWGWQCFHCQKQEAVFGEGGSQSMALPAVEDGAV